VARHIDLTHQCPISLGFSTPIEMSHFTHPRFEQTSDIWGE